MFSFELVSEILFDLGGSFISKNSKYEMGETLISNNYKIYIKIISNKE